MPTTPEQAERWADAQAVRHGGRRAEDRATARAVHQGLQMVQDRGPDTVPVAPAEASTEIGAEPGHPRIPRHRPLLTAAGRLWVPYLIGLAAIAAWLYSAAR